MKTKFVEGSKWKLVGRSMPKEAWTVTLGFLCSPGDGFRIPVEHINKAMWESAEDPFVTFVRKVLEDNSGHEI